MSPSLLTGPLSPGAPALSDPRPRPSALRPAPVSPQRGGRDDRDAAPPLSAEQLLLEERRRRQQLERQELERRRHGDCFTSVLVF